MSTSIDFNNFLHESRSVCVEKIPPAKKILSIGCAGKWYFEWFHQFYPYSVELHTGIDLNLPPEDLPSNVTWIQHDCSNLDVIKSETFDLVFAGQFIEHISWDGQVTFLIEVHRVLKPNGIFVLDSPNYHITNRYGWRQPEHIHELSPEQAFQLLELSGFEIQSSCGLVPTNLLGKPPKLLGKCLESSFAVSFHQEDINHAISMNINNSMIWWITAVKKANAVCQKKLRAKSYNFFRKNQKEKLSILFNQIGKIVQHGSRYFVVLNPSDGPGCALFGPYDFYAEGYYSVEFSIQILNNSNNTFRKKLQTFVQTMLNSNFQTNANNNSDESKDANCVVGLIDVATDQGSSIIAKKEVLLCDLLKKSKISLSFHLDQLTALEFRFLYFPSTSIKVNVQRNVSKLRK